ncbi:hypothetical protein ACFX2I_021788 [Malus domestica]
MTHSSSSSTAFSIFGTVGATKSSPFPPSATASSPPTYEDTITPDQEQVFVVAHDWGTIIAWYLCLFQPDQVKALVSWACNSGRETLRGSSSKWFKLLMATTITFAYFRGGDRKGEEITFAANEVLCNDRWDLLG